MHVHDSKMDGKPWQCMREDGALTSWAKVKESHWIPCLYPWTNLTLSPSDYSMNNMGKNWFFFICLWIIQSWGLAWMTSWCPSTKKLPHVTEPTMHLDRTHDVKWFALLLLVMSCMSSVIMTLDITNSNKAKLKNDAMTHDIIFIYIDGVHTRRLTNYWRKDGKANNIHATKSYSLFRSTFWKQEVHWILNKFEPQLSWSKTKFSNPLV